MDYYYRLPLQAIHAIHFPFDSFLLRGLVLIVLDAELGHDDSHCLLGGHCRKVDRGDFGE